MPGPALIALTNPEATLATQDATRAGDSLTHSRETGEEGLHRGRGGGDSGGWVERLVHGAPMPASQPYDMDTRSVTALLEEELEESITICTDGCDMNMIAATFLMETRVRWHERN